MSTVDFSRVNELAKKYEPEMTRFLRDMIRIPSESCQEEGVIRRIKEEMEKVVNSSVPLTTEVGVGKTWLEAH